jgi:hypothetical protein
MQTSDFFKKYGLDSLKIHAVCEELGLSRDEARVYSYIHIKADESGKGLDYFRIEQPETIKALELLRGKMPDADIPTGPDTTYSPERELEDRIKMHSDPAFRDEKLAFYEQEILPKLDEIDNDRMQKALGLNASQFSGLLAKMSGNNEIQRLTDEMNAAAAREDFDKAAELRDQLRELQEEL